MRDDLVRVSLRLLRVLGIALLGITMLGAVACGDDDDDAGSAGTAPTGNGLAVVATTTIIADLARNVAGEHAAVSSLLPANADPHDFEPNPSDLEMAADADLILEHGLELDTWAEDLIDESGANAPVAVVTDGVRTAFTRSLRMKRPLRTTSMATLTRTSGSMSPTPR
jgi:ABC-type Zn uptake system ZnuABC Zn-binding protein ZnuA